jgi:hypothetical protein
MRAIRTGIIICICVFGAAATANVARAADVSQAEIAQLRLEIRELSIKLEAQGEARTRQADAFNADALAITIASGIAILFITLGGVAATFFGFKFVQRQVADLVAHRVDGTIRKHGAEVFEREAGALHHAWDEKFARLYERAVRIDGNRD